MKNFPAKPALDEFKSPTAMGVFFGVDREIKNKILLGFNVRLFGENSGTLSLLYRL